LQNIYMVKFAYAVGRIRALEANLLDESRLIRMIDAKDFESAYLVLQEAPFFAEKINQLPHPFDFDRLLELELETSCKILAELAPGNPLIEVLSKKNDPSLPLDSYIRLLAETSRRHPSPLFRKYVRGFIVLNQLKFRLLQGKFEPEAVIAEFRYTDYYPAVQHGMESYKTTGSLFALEREIDNHLTRTIQMAKYKAFGIEPLIGFMIAKEIEVKIIRLILTCKQLQVKTEEIKARMRLSYV
jgi:vacuolar-type H+-ATPase subunit C/Vma6